jgi:hypothetical protein
LKQLTYIAFRGAQRQHRYETEKPVVERLAALNPVPSLVIFGWRDALLSPESQLCEWCREGVISTTDIRPWSRRPSVPR